VVGRGSNPMNCARWCTVFPVQVCKGLVVRCKFPRFSYG
jgi:hypothetical protein